MRNKTFIIGVAVVVALLCLYHLSFTFVARSVEKDAVQFATDESGNLDRRKQQQYLDSLYRVPVWMGFTFQEIKQHELGLGLDLKGGMHVTMEVSPVEIIQGLAGNSKNPQFLAALKKANERQRNSQESFVSLFGRAYEEEVPNGRLSAIFANNANKGRINYDTPNSDILAMLEGEVDEAIERSFDILRTRIDKFGTTQPNIQRQKGTGRIQIELPGVDNPARVRKLLQGTAELEFLEVYTTNEIAPYFNQLNDLLVKKEAASAIANNNVLADATTTDTAATAETDLAAQLSGETAGTDSATAQADSLNTKQSTLLADIFKFTYYGPAASLRDTSRVNRLLASNDVKGLFPSNMKFLWDAKPTTLNGQPGGEEILQLYAVKKGRGGKAPLTGEYITDARQDFGQTGQPEVSMTMNSTGAKRWKKLTGDNVGRNIAIVLDDNVYSAPTVNQEISGGSSSISGNFTIEEAQDLAQVLKAGKLPAPTRIVEEAVVGPSLGQEAISQGLLSTLGGLALVVLFMVMYYNRGGWIANFALLINVFFILGVLSQFGAALTLPGIAGIVLTLGIAVDANVLIFERIKEEMRQNPGMAVKDAIAKGYDRAFSSIFDSNVTSILVAIILYYFGTGPVKGFAITLIIGIVFSFLTAVYITRLILDWMAERGKADTLRLETPMSRSMYRRTNINFVGNRKKIYLFSGAVIAAGFIAAVINGGFDLGVDFKGGRSYVVQFDKEMVASDVRANLIDDLQGAGIEVKTYGAPDRLKITTSYLAEDESQEADETVKNALMGGLEEYSSLNPNVLSTAKVGATMADDIQRTSQVAIVLSILAIFLYILLRFRKWQYSFGAVVALTHDVIVVFAMIAIAGLFGFSFEIDQIMIAALLTLVGYSINDTVVVFDRVREEVALNPREPEESVVNRAINVTLSRTFVTSLTVFVVVVVLLIFGGEVMRGFAFALVVGVIFGTYSSICIATPLALDLMKKKKEEKVTVNA